MAFGVCARVLLLSLLAFREHAKALSYRSGASSGIRPHSELAEDFPSGYKPLASSFENPAQPGGSLYGYGPSYTEGASSEYLKPAAAPRWGGSHASYGRRVAGYGPGGSVSSYRPGPLMHQKPKQNPQQPPYQANPNVNGVSQTKAGMWDFALPQNGNRFESGIASSHGIEMLHDPPQAKPQAPSYPAKPQAPSYPAKPQAPSYPAKPQAPSYPAKPQAPSYPAKPQAPSYQAPSYPAKPQAPSYQAPSYPAKPQAPSYQAPSYPAKPQAPSYQAPSYPAKPQAPSYPAKPQAPSYPAKPQAPSYPAKPQAPSYPAKPQAPSYPAKPQAPSYPAKPQAPSYQAPSYPAKPQAPSYPAKPQAPSYPAKPQPGVTQTKAGMWDFALSQEGVPRSSRPIPMAPMYHPRWQQPLVPVYDGFRQH